MKRIESLGKLVLACFFTAAIPIFTGCDVDEGPVEESREAVESAADEVEDVVDDTVDN